MEATKKVTGKSVKKWLGNNAIIVLMLAVSLIVGIIHPNFFALANIINLFKNVSIRYIIAQGISGCLITTGNDLSAGRLAGFAACLACIFAQTEGAAGKFYPNMPTLPTPVVFILVIAVLVQLIEITLKKYVPALYQSLGVYLPLITTNCCVLGVTILAVQDYSAVVAEFGFGLAYAEALICAAGAGVGFLVAMLLFCGVRSRVEAANPPESFKGLPITLVSAAITSMSFMGFGGLVENIINAIF